MARFHGKGGSVSIGSAIYHIYSWSLTLNADIVDVTAFADTWQRKVVGDPGATIDIEGYLDSATLPKHPTAAGAVGTTVTFTCMQDSTLGFTGVAVIGSMSMNVAHDGAASVSLSCEVDGTVSQVT